MIHVPRRGIICLDSQIEKINHLRLTFNFIMGRFQIVLSRGILAEFVLSLSFPLPLSPSLPLSLSQQLLEPACPVLVIPW